MFRVRILSLKNFSENKNGYQVLIVSTSLFFDYQVSLDFDFDE
jgi:hypothetical protein